MTNAELLLKQIVEAIEANRTENGRGFYPLLVFESLPDGWLKSAKEAVAQPEAV